MLACVDLQEASEVERPRIRAQMAQLAAVEMSSSGEAAKGLEARPVKTELNFQRMLEAFV